MLDLIRRYDEVAPRLKTDGRPGLALSDVTIEAPIPRPFRNVMCVGKNYHEHAHEFAGSGFDSSATSKADAVPAAPIIFTKVPESVIADGMPIRYPAGVSDGVDYEAELAVVIGKGGRGIARDAALDHVWGLYHRQRRGGPRLAGTPQAVVPGQELRHLLSHGAVDRHRRRAGGRQSRGPLLGQ